MVAQGWKVFTQHAGSPGFESTTALWCAPVTSAAEGWGGGWGGGRGIQVQGHPWLNNKTETTLGYVKSIVFWKEPVLQTV